MRKTIVTGIAALLVCGLTVPVSASASAPSQFEAAEISVSFADLNIHNDAGARVLYERLQAASKKVCSVESFRKQGSLARVAQTEQCYVEALDEAVAEIDSEALQKIHSS